MVKTFETENLAEYLFNTQRVLCIVITNTKEIEDNVDYIMNTWGKRCNKIIFFSQSDREFNEKEDIWVRKVKFSLNQQQKRILRQTSSFHRSRIISLEWEKFSNSFMRVKCIISTGYWMWPIRRSSWWKIYDISCINIIQSGHCWLDRDSWMRIIWLELLCCRKELLLDLWRTHSPILSFAVKLVVFQTRILQNVVKMWISSRLMGSTMKARECFSTKNQNFRCFQCDSI